MGERIDREAKCAGVPWSESVPLLLIERLAQLLLLVTASVNRVFRFVARSRRKP